MSNASMVQNALDEAREALLRADVAGLNAAAAAMGKAESGLRDPRRFSAGELISAQRSIRRLGHLLEGIRVFHEGLSRLRTCVDDAVANYTRPGRAPAEDACAQSVNLSG